MMTWSIIYVQDMNHRMQTTQERSEYALVINSVKFMQQTSLPQSDGDSNVLIIYQTEGYRVYLPDK